MSQPIRQIRHAPSCLFPQNHHWSLIVKFNSSTQHSIALQNNAHSRRCRHWRNCFTKRGAAWTIATQSRRNNKTTFSECGKHCHHKSESSSKRKRQQLFLEKPLEQPLEKLLEKLLARLLEEEDGLPIAKPEWKHPKVQEKGHEDEEIPSRRRLPRFCQFKNAFHTISALSLVQEACCKQGIGCKIQERAPRKVSQKERECAKISGATGQICMASSSTTTGVGRNSMEKIFVVNWVSSTYSRESMPPWIAVPISLGSACLH